jgi:hypothetical protein
VLTVSNGATTINLQFDSAFSGKHFVLSADGHGGSNLHLLSGAAATVTASAHDLMNFVSEEHHELMGDRFTLGIHATAFDFTVHTDPAFLALGGHGFSSNAITDHGLVHASVMLR